jgi:hypothetical protein
MVSCLLIRSTEKQEALHKTMMEGLQGNQKETRQPEGKEILDEGRIKRLFL